MLRAVLYGGSLALVPVYMSHVHATSDGRKVKVKDLSPYGEPNPPELIYTPEKISNFREKISMARQTLSGVTESMQSTTENIKQKLEVAQAHTMDVVHYFQEDAGAVAKATFITVAGLGGLITGYKGRPGSPVKTALLTVTLVTGATAICYPEPMSKVANSTWDKMKEQYEQMRNSEKPVQVSNTSEATESHAEGNSKDSVQMQATSDTNVNVKESQQDHGMSKPEDKDMYSTRTS